MDLSRHINVKWIKPPVFSFCLVPFAQLALAAFHNGLGANPIETITHSTGTWALVFLCITLTVTPLRHLLHQNWLNDVYKRPFITAGFTAVVLMAPLAVTSTSGMIRRLGGKRWRMLHRLVYFSAIAAAIHYYWLVKSDESVPLRFAGVIGILLLYRLLVGLSGRLNRARVPGTVARYFNQ